MRPERATNSDERVKEMGNKILRLGVAAFFVAASAFLCGCGGNSTPVGVTVTPLNPSVPLGGQQQFQAVVTGTSTTSVTWQICLLPTPTQCPADDLQPGDNRTNALAERLRDYHQRADQHAARGVLHCADNSAADE